MFVEIKLNICLDKTRGFLAVFVATKLDIVDEMSGRSSAMLTSTKLNILYQTFGHFPALWKSSLKSEPNQTLEGNLSRFLLLRCIVLLLHTLKEQSPAKLTN